MAVVFRLAVIVGAGPLLIGRRSRFEAADVTGYLFRKFEGQEETAVKEHIPTVHIEKTARQPTATPQ